jgi:hypothetical protein
MTKNQKINLLAGIIVGAFMLVLLGIASLWAQWAYGDWTCAVKQCVQVSEKK